MNLLHVLFRTLADIQAKDLAANIIASIVFAASALVIFGGYSRLKFWLSVRRFVGKYDLYGQSQSRPTGEDIEVKCPLWSFVVGSRKILITCKRNGSDFWESIIFMDSQSSDRGERYYRYNSPNLQGGWGIRSVFYDGIHEIFYVHMQEKTHVLAGITEYSFSLRRLRPGRDRPEPKGWERPIPPPPPAPYPTHESSMIAAPPRLPVATKSD